MLDPYEDLGLERGASAKEVKAAFRKLAVSAYCLRFPWLMATPLCHLWLVCPWNHSSYPF
jgi:hypothetical protein